MQTKAQLKASAKYKKAHIKRVALEMKKEYFDEVIKPEADRAGLPVNTYIKQAIAEKIEREKK